MIPVEVLRLQPGVDVRRELERFAKERGVRAGFILSGIGSLKRAAIRFAGLPSATRVEGDLEILTLSGTLGVAGVHFHIAVSDREGRVIGGHVSDGCIVRTTAEIVIGLAEGWTFAREADPATGYRELQPRRDE